MYCSKCGKHIGDNDRFCSGCGSRIEKSEERMISDSSLSAEKTEEQHAPYTLDTSEFVWDVDEFRREHKIAEDVKVDWKQGIVTEAGSAPETESVPETENLSQTQRTAENTSESAPATENSDLDEIKEHIKAEEEKIREVREAAEKLHEAEMKKRTQEYHFKFVPAKEDEYEHIHRSEPDENLDENGEVFEHVTLDDISDDVEINSSPANSAMKRDTARLDKFYTFNKKNEEFQRLLDKEYERISSGKGGDTEPEVFDPVAHLKEAEAARKAILGGSEQYDDGTDDFELRRFDTAELEKDLMESSDSFSDKADKSDKSVKITESYVGGEYEEYDEGEKDSDEEPANIGDDAQEFYDDDLRGRSMSFTTELDKLFGDAEEFEESKKEKKAKKKKAKKSDNPFMDEQSYGYGGYDEYDRNNGTPDKYDGDDDYDDDEGGRSVFGKVLLIVIIIILVIELAVLGIKYFAPDSKAAAFVNNMIADTVSFFAGIGQSDDKSDDGGENDGGAADSQDEQTGQDAGAQAESMNTIISEQMNLYNKNIEMIIYDENQCYDQQVKYGSDSVHGSKPITDNVLYTDEAGNVYYADREAIGTLIAFDSGWIDYVNSRDKAVFDVIKKDSNAYKNCAAFNQNVKKTFKTLKIGEIRQDENGYYVWARETIETVSGGKTTSDDFNWVYYMEPENEKLLIVDYYKF